MNQFAFRTLNNLDPETQKKLRKRLEKPIVVRQQSNGADLSGQFTRVQIRKTYHSPDKIIRMLDYKPRFISKQRMQNYKDWLKFANII